jgi:hypothetical protein
VFVRRRHGSPEQHATTKNAFVEPRFQSSRLFTSEVVAATSSDTPGFNRETKEDDMQEVQQYRQYVRECVRLAATASAKDKLILLKIAEAWEQQAKIAEAASKKKPGGKSDGATPTP